MNAKIRQYRLNKSKPQEVHRKLRSTIIDLWNQITSFSWNGEQLSTAYDTAWVASLLTNQDEPKFPFAINWLIKNQHKDGSWGANVINENICDKLISTATASFALSKYHEKYSCQLDLGLNWLESNILNFKENLDEIIETVGFELLFPNTLLKLQENNLINYDISSILTLQEKKLKKLSVSHIIIGKTPVIFSLEFLDRLIDEEKIPLLDTQVSRNGSVGCSPATTAWLSTTKSRSYHSLMHYLLSSSNYDEGWPHFQDSRLFSIAYSLYSLQSSLGYVPSSLKYLLKEIYKSWTPLGIGFSKHFPLPDFDDTIVALNLLQSNKILHDSQNDRFWSVIPYYQADTHYKSYPWENNESYLVNLHVLDTLKDKGKYREESEMLLTFFSKYLTKNKSFHSDKYHNSAYLQNSRAIQAFSKIAPDLASFSLKWFENQLDEIEEKNDFKQTDLEDLANLVIAYCYYHLNYEKLDINRLEPIIDYIIDNVNSKMRPNWISKVLYAPKEIQKSILFSSLVLYYKSLGNEIIF